MLLIEVRDELLDARKYSQSSKCGGNGRARLQIRLPLFSDSPPKEQVFLVNTFRAEICLLKDLYLFFRHLKHCWVTQAGVEGIEGSGGYLYAKKHSLISPKRPQN